jgi:type IV secretion system protein VirB1
MQVNNRNLPALGYTVEQVLDDPCTNIRAGAAVLTADYAAAVRTHGEGQLALQAALSAYNTGDFYRGFANGYVARYYGPGGAPALTSRVPSVAATAVKHEALQPWPTTKNIGGVWPGCGWRCQCCDFPRVPPYGYGSGQVRITSTL